MSIQTISKAIGQLQDPFFYGNGVKTASLYNAFSAEAFIRRMDAIRMRHHPMEDEVAIARTAENLRDSAENWWLSICALESDQAPVRTQWTAFVERFKFSFCKETTRWDTATAYLELKQRPEQPPNEYLHAIVQLYAKHSKALLEEQIKTFATHVSYTISNAHAAILIKGTATSRPSRSRPSWRLCDAITERLRAPPTSAAIWTSPRPWP
jgi:hypothetical protein